MGKKRQARRGSAADDGAPTPTSLPSARTVFTASPSTTTARDALQNVLEHLDGIALEAHVYTKQQQQQHTAALNCVAEAPLKRARDERVSDGIAEGKAERGSSMDMAKAQMKGSRLDVLAATSAVHYQSLCTIVAAYGLQLLPSLEEILKRVTLAVLTPALSTPEAWETLAMLCTMFRAGAAHALLEVLGCLLTEPGVLLLDAPQLVPTWYAELYVHSLPTAAASNTATAALGDLLTFAEDQTLRGAASDETFEKMTRIITERTARKLRALADMIYAAGGYMPTVTLQQVALRYTKEVVEGGVLPCYVTELERRDLFGTETEVLGSPHDAPSAPPGASVGLAALRWRVPASWHAACVQLIEAFLLTSRPAVPAELLVTSTRVINTLSARLHRGVPVLRATDGNSSAVINTGKDHDQKGALPPLPVTPAVGAAVVRLGHVLQLLHHPVVLPPLQPAQLVMERAKRRLFVAADAPAPQTESRPIAPVTAVAPSNTNSASTLAPSPAAPAPLAALPRPPSAPAAAPIVQSSKPQLNAVQATRPRLKPAMDDADDIPDIVMDD